MNRNRSFAKYIEVRGVGREQKVIGRDGGTQQHGPLVPKIEGKLRQVPHPVVVQALLAHAGRLHVTQAVEDEEHSAVLENPGPIVRPGGGGRYVVLAVWVPTPTQLTPPSPPAIEPTFGERVAGKC